MQPKRDVSIDLLRIFCCFLVVGIHVSPLYDSFINFDVPDAQKIVALLIQGLVRAGLPVFFLLSGYYLLNANITSLKSFYKRRLASILIPFIIYSLIHYEIFSLLNGLRDPAILIGGYFKGLLNSTGISVHFWFVYTIVGIYLIAPFINRILAAMPQKYTFPAIVILLAIMMYNVYFRALIPGFAIPYPGDWLSYFIIGGLLNRLPTVKLSTSLLLVAVGYISTCVITYYQLRVKGIINFYAFDAGFNMLIFTCGLTLLFRGLHVQVNERTAKTIAWVSSQTYGIYLIHAIVLYAVVTHYDNSWYASAVAQYTLGMTLFVFVVSLLLTYAIDSVLTNRLVRAFK